MGIEESIEGHARRLQSIGFFRRKGARERLSGDREMNRPRHRQQALTPDTHVSLTIIQLIALVLGLLAVAGGYVWLKVDASSAKTTAELTSTKVDTLGTKVEAAIQSNANQFKDQDNKREQLGKDFIASQQQIVAKVSELNTAVLLQQHDTKTIAETLAKISDQLNTVAIAPKGK
jgi:hypothetical protein